jgi:glutathione S-transferase
MPRDEETQAMTLTLYVAEPGSVPIIGASPPSWMCALLLAEKGLAHEVVPLSFARGEHRSPAMLARNPRGTIPVLVDGDAVVHETFAILLYLEHLVPGHLPAARADRARALTRFFEADALKSAGMTALAYLMRTDERQRDPAVLATHGEALRAELARWEAYLGVAGYVCGDQLTLADIAVFPYLAVLRQLGLSLAAMPRLAAYHDRVAARPAAVATRPPERLPWARSPWDCLP